MEIHTNQELTQAVNDLIEKSGYKRIYIAEKLGIANQNLKRFLNKDNFSIDDANKVLDILGYKASIRISKKDWKNY